MATVGQIYYNILDNNSGSYISSGTNIYSNIVTAYGATRFNKLGVQAPPGTQMVLNASKTIMVGRTGIYELDDDIVITDMYFVKPKRYKKDETASSEALAKGTDGMLQANTTRTNALADLALDYPGGAPPQPTDSSTEAQKQNYEAYWNRYNMIQSEYITSYQDALSLFNQGSNGIYVLDEINPYQELYNVIIDFIYE